MADITDQHDQTSPTELDDSQNVGNGNAAESRGVKRQRPSAGDDDDDDDEKGSRERRKIEIKFISDKSRRHITFSKRKAGIMKKVSFCPIFHQQHQACCNGQHDQQHTSRRTQSATRSYQRDFTTKFAANWCSGRSCAAR